VMKRIAACFLAFAFMLSNLTAMASGGVPVFAGMDDIPVMETNPDIDPNMDEDFEAIPVLAQFTQTLPAKSAILMDQQTGKILYELNADEQIPPASITKIMTMLLVVEALESGKIKLEDMVPTSEYANSMGGSQIWLKVGEEMSVENLLKAVAIASANDASAALGEHIAGSNEAFVAMMNQRAKELGMSNTLFLNTTGLDEEGHLTTARDIAIMSRELVKHDKITEYTTIWMDSLRGGETELVNTNKLVRFYKGATGLKTGTTSGAGSCLAATATRDGLSLVSVVMGCPTSNDRFALARGLLDFGFANYESVTPPPIDDKLKPVKILRGVEESVMPRPRGVGAFVIEKGQKENLTQEITLIPDIEAPVEAGQVVGKAQVLVNGELMGEYSLVASEDVARMTFPKAFNKLVRAMLKMNRAAPVRTMPVPGAGGQPQPEGAGGESAAEPEGAEPCSCGEDKCYCAQIGDICGCTRKE